MQGESILLYASANLFALCNEGALALCKHENLLLNASGNASCLMQVGEPLALCKRENLMHYARKRDLHYTTDRVSCFMHC